MKLWHGIVRQLPQHFSREIWLQMPTYSCAVQLRGICDESQSPNNWPLPAARQ